MLYVLEFHENEPSLPSFLHYNCPSTIHYFIRKTHAYGERGNLYWRFRWMWRRLQFKVWIYTHPGGKPSCAVNNNYPACRCYYECAPPPPPPVTKRCRHACSVWEYGGVGCSDRDCDWQCNFNYPGLVLEIRTWVLFAHCSSSIRTLLVFAWLNVMIKIMLGLRTIVLDTISEVLGFGAFNLGVL